MLDIAWVGCMGVFVQDMLCTVAVYLCEECTLIDISTDAIKEELCKAFGL